MTLDDARAILGAVAEDDGSLDSWPASVTEWPYTTYQPGSGSATLDGHYSADQLEAIAVWMRSHEG